MKYRYSNKKLTLALVVFVVTSCAVATTKLNSFKPGSDIWPDNNGVHINAHGGGVLYHQGTYYWFGEHKIKGKIGNSAQVGVHCYSSTDLYNWTDEGIVLKVSNNPNSDIIKGCVIERPKVIYNKKTNKFVMWFHLELKGKGYDAARTGVAVSDTVTGPYQYLKSHRPNPNRWPINYSVGEWFQNDKYLKRDFKTGQMSRDMTLFVDDDDKAYHIHASEDNRTIHICDLTDDYLGFTGKYSRVFPEGWNEAPAICKYNNKYFMITSGCTGWKPNAARSAVADNIFGPWKPLGNPCRRKNLKNGLGPHLTFGGQSTYILPVQGKEDAFIAMFDIWTPKNPIDGKYIWLPVEFRANRIFVRWRNEWDLSIFDRIVKKKNWVSKDSEEPQPPSYELVWSDEFDINGPPDPCNWIYEHGFVRNQELQWYQPNNAQCKNGMLVIEAKREQVKNNRFDPKSKNWRQRRKYARYTSASIKTRGLHSWLYGRFEARARIDTRDGSWPAFWTVGFARGWPGCGEIDIMEYYQNMVLANACWAGNKNSYKPKWDAVKKNIEYFQDPNFSSKFHVWRMDWTKDYILLYIDDILINTIDLSRTINYQDKTNPFREPHYIILNLAIGGDRGGDPSRTKFPIKYEVDYVRVYQDVPRKNR